MKQYKVIVTISMLVDAEDTNEATTKVKDTLEGEWLVVEEIEVEEMGLDYT